MGRAGTEASETEIRGAQGAALLQDYRYKEGAHEAGLSQLQSQLLENLPKVLPNQLLQNTMEGGIPQNLHPNLEVGSLHLQGSEDGLQWPYLLHTGYRTCQRALKIIGFYHEDTSCLEEGVLVTNQAEEGIHPWTGGQVSCHCGHQVNLSFPDLGRWVPQICSCLPLFPAWTGSFNDLATCLFFFWPMEVKFLRAFSTHCYQPQAGAQYSGLKKGKK